MSCNFTKVLGNKTCNKVMLPKVGQLLNQLLCGFLGDHLTRGAFFPGLWGLLGFSLCCFFPKNFTVMNQFLIIFCSSSPLR